MQDKKSKYSITPGEYTANIRKEDGYSGISEAIEYGDIDAVKQFIKDGADLHRLSSFFCNISIHNDKTLHFLIEQGLDIFEDDMFMDFIIRRYEDDVRSYKEGGQPNRGGDRFSSERDIHNKYLGIIKAMVEHGYDVNKPMYAQCTPLRSVLLSKAIPELVFYLVEECSADVNYAKYDIEEKYKQYADNADEFGYDPVSIDEFKECRPWSPLMRACRWNPGEVSFEICKLLVRHGADVNYISHEYAVDGEREESSPLCNAIEHENIPVVQLLIESGADVNLTMHGTELWDDSDERSPLLVALHVESIPIIKLLLENGAEITDSVREYVDECDFDDEIRELFGM